MHHEHSIDSIKENVILIKENVISTKQSVILIKEMSFSDIQCQITGGNRAM